MRSTPESPSSPRGSRGGNQRSTRADTETRSSDPSPGPDTISSGAPEIRRLAPWQWAVAGSVLLAHVIFAWLSRVPGVSSRNDDATYLLLARSLRSFHYANFEIGGAAVHSQYPPGYPAILAVIGALLGDRFDFYIAAGILASAGALGLTFLLARRFLSPGLALLMLAAAGLNPQVISYAGNAVSETWFMALVILGLWAALSLPGSRRQLWLVTVTVIAAALTRTIGVALVGAVIVAWLLDRRFRDGLVVGLAAAFMVGPWLLWSALAPKQAVGRSYAADVVGISATGSSPLLHALRYTLEFKLPRYVTESLSAAFAVPTIEGTIVDNVLWTLLIVGLGILGLYALRRRGRILILFLGFYAAVLLAWPWARTRYLIPLVPLLTLVLLVGAWELGRRFGPRLAWGGSLCLCLTLEVEGVRGDVAGVQQYANCDRGNPTASLGCFNQDQLSFFAAGRFTGGSTPASAIILTSKEATFAYYANRRTLFAGRVMDGPTENFLPWLRREGIDYIILGRTTHQEMEKLSETLLAVCDHLELVRAFPPHTYLFQIAPDDATPGPLACRALSSYRADQSQLLPAR